MVGLFCCIFRNFPAALHVGCAPPDGGGMFSYFRAMFSIYCLETLGGWPHSLVGGDTSWSFCISQIVVLSKFSCGFLFFFFLLKNLLIFSTKKILYWEIAN